MNLEQLKQEMAKRAGEEVDDREILWLYSYWQGEVAKEQWDARDWAYAFLEGIEPATMEHVEEWLENDTDDNELEAFLSRFYG